MMDVPLPSVVDRESLSQYRQCPHAQQIRMIPTPTEGRALVQDESVDGGRKAGFDAAAWHASGTRLSGIVMRKATMQGLLTRCATGLEIVEAPINRGMRQSGVIDQHKTRRLACPWQRRPGPSACTSSCRPPHSAAGNLPDVRHGRRCPDYSERGALHGPPVRLAVL